MREIRTEDAVGLALCHDLTQIVPGQFKGARFRRGHIVEAVDIPVLLSMGKRTLFVQSSGAMPDGTGPETGRVNVSTESELIGSALIGDDLADTLPPGTLHEDEAADRLRALCQNEGMWATKPKEGKIELYAERDGLFRVDAARLEAVNGVPDLMIAVRRGDTPVQAGDLLAGMRAIPLVVDEARLREAEELCGPPPLLEVRTWTVKTAAVIATGSEVADGLIEDAFTPVVRRKLAGYGIEVTDACTPGDDRAAIADAVRTFHNRGADLILCTGGMSVDPDDRTPGAIRDAGVEIVTYGAPVLPGAMFLLGYFPDGVPVCGLPGCVMFARRTIFDAVLPRVAAGVRMEKRDFIRMGNGGLCLNCERCVWPACGFGTG